MRASNLKPVALDWYKREIFADGVTLISEIHIASWLKCNIWYIQGRDRDLVIDTGMGLRSLVDEIALITDRPQIAVATHSHFDHSGGLHEFGHRYGHPLEAHIFQNPTQRDTLIDAGYVREETFLELPYDGFDYRQYKITPAPLTQHIDEGDVIDLGNRVFRILHLPGHSPGSIALFEEETGLFFSGDVIYDGELLDSLHCSNRDHFKQSLERLRDLPIKTIHAGHFPSFGKTRMQNIIDQYMSVKINAPI